MMDEIIVVILFILWYVGALVVSETAKKNAKAGTEWLFFIGIIFSPVIGYIFYLVAGKR